MRSLSLTAQTIIRTADVNRLILPIAQRYVQSHFDCSSSGFECHLSVDADEIESGRIGCCGSCAADRSESRSTLRMLIA